MKTLIYLAMVAVLFYVCAGALIYFLQRKLIYHPTPIISHPFDEMAITVDTANHIKLNIIVANEGKPDAVIYFGGNAESVAFTANDLATALPQRTLYMVNYRGYGGSDGTPSETALFNDAEFIFDAVNAKHNSIAVVGRSLGSGVASRLATRKPVERLALITPYDSILNIASTAYPVFPVKWLLKDRFESNRYAPQIDAPVLVLIAENDAVIPMQSTLNLVAAFKQKVDQQLFEGSGHNDLQTHADFYPTLSAFINAGNR